ncbi:DUF1775 domain-containing protein [Baekduia sp. Peel2402]|uniref:DUF1775 domain-containing protein n=1 Tax=Baekduia sp. Peel2402 TaxID=3458296 RepID=UPI00403E574D
MRRAVLTAVAAALVAAAPAAAHVQITPTVAAPGDSAKFTVLVPGETEAQTTKVELKVPAGVLPFSYNVTPGWKRTLVSAADGSVDRIVWTGRLPRDGFVELAFLAGLPEQPGTLAWKALQTYSDGTVVRWIGGPESEHPAPTTVLEAGAAKQNAGGEGEGTTRDVAEAPGEAATSDSSSATDTSADNGPDWLARALALAALLGLAATTILLRRPTR